MQEYLEIKRKNGFVLRGYQNIPKKASEALIMFHGFTGNKTEHGRMFKTLSDLLEKEDIATFRLDFFGNAESDGDFSDFTFDTLIEDAELIINYVEKLNKFNKINLLGFSMGGAIASAVACSNEAKISKLILWSPAGNIGEIVERYYQKNKKISEDRVDFLGFELSKKLVDSFINLAPFENLNKFNKEVLIIHGEEDLAVPLSFGKKYYEGFSNSNLEIIKGAGHGYDSVQNRKYLLDKTVSFLKV